MNAILVQMGNSEWTTEAMHYACATARETKAIVNVVRFAPVKSVHWLGAEGAILPLNRAEQAVLQTAQTIACQYEVVMRSHTMQYTSLVDAIGEMAHNLDVDIVVATLPTSAVPYWRKYATWSLQRALRGREWVALDNREVVPLLSPAFAQ